MGRKRTLHFLKPVQSTGLHLPLVPKYNLGTRGINQRNHVEPFYRSSRPAISGASHSEFDSTGDGRRYI